MKDNAKILIVALAGWLLYSRSASANTGSGDTTNDTGGGGGLNLPSIGSSAPLPPGTMIPQSGTAPGLNGGEVPNFNYDCGTAANPFIGTITDPQDGRVIGVCAGDPRVSHPSYEPYETANPFEIALY